MCMSVYVSRGMCTTFHQYPKSKSHRCIATTFIQTSLVITHSDTQSELVSTIGKEILNPTKICWFAETTPNVKMRDMAKFKSYGSDWFLNTQ